MLLRHLPARKHIEINSEGTQHRQTWCQVSEVQTVDVIVLSVAMSNQPSGQWRGGPRTPPLSGDCPGLEDQPRSEPGPSTVNSRIHLPSLLFLNKADIWAENADRLSLYLLVKWWGHYRRKLALYTITKHKHLRCNFQKVIVNGDTLHCPLQIIMYKISTIFTSLSLATHFFWKSVDENVHVRKCQISLLCRCHLGCMHSHQ